MNRTYYTRELARLRNGSKAFANQYPSIAPLLVEDSTDPDVERLLEGFAYLTAELNQKLDDEFPELINGLTNVFFPSYLRPVPCAVMLEFVPKENVGQSIAVKKHTQVASVPIDGVKCFFRTVAAMNIEPLRLIKSEYITSAQGHYALKLDLSCLGLLVSRWTADSINFYLADSATRAADIFYILSRYCDRVGLKTADTAEFYLPAAALRAKQLSENIAFDFDAHTDIPSRHIFRQYLTFPQQFLQLELTGLNQWQERGKTKDFSLTFYLKALPEWFSVTTIPKIALNATPTINIFPENGRSLNLDQTHFEYQVLIDAANADNMAIFAIKKVEGLTSIKNIETYQPFSQALNNLVVLNSYETHYRPTADGAEMQWYISLNSLTTSSSSDDNSADFSQNPSKLNKTLRFDLLCCNAGLAMRVLPGMLTQSTNSTPATTSFSNLHTPTMYYPIDLNEASLWRLLSLLSYNFFAEADIKLFKEILLLESNFLKGYDKNRLEKRLSGIAELTVARAERLYYGKVIVGFDVLISCELNVFDSRGDLFLFFSIIDLFFANQIPLNTYIKLSVKINDTGDILTWPTRTADKILP